jgi:transcriptional regulator with XRE-family HTH domain
MIIINRKKIGERIKEARQIARITQKQLAIEMNMKQQAYSRFETGIFELDYEKIIYICKRLQVSADYLLGLENEDGTKIYEKE